MHMLSLSKPLQEIPTDLDKCLLSMVVRVSEFVNDKEIIRSPDESNTHSLLF